MDFKKISNFIVNHKYDSEKSKLNIIEAKDLKRFIKISVNGGFHL